MAIDEGALLQGLNLGTVNTAVDSLLSNIAKEIQQLYIDVIKENSERSSSSIGQSVVGIPSGNELRIEADAAFLFIDNGVNAAPINENSVYTRARVSNSPYSFKTSKPSLKMAEALGQWAGSGSPNWGLATSVKKHGIVAKNITDKVWTEQNISIIESKILEATGMVVSLIFDKYGDNN